MSILSKGQEDLVRERQAALRDILAEIEPVLSEFLAILHLSDSSWAFDDPNCLVPQVGKWLAPQVVAPDLRNWLMARVAYIVGESLRHSSGGVWIVDQDPQSPTFARVVIARSEEGEPGFAVDPFELASRLVDEPPGRDLDALIQSARVRFSQRTSGTQAPKSASGQPACDQCRKTGQFTLTIAKSRLCEVCVVGMLSGAVGALCMRRGVNILMSLQEAEGRLRRGETQLDEWLREAAAILPSQV